MVAASNARKAVLIGVPEYRAKDDLPAIPTVANDLRQLEVVLRSTGYDDVTTLPEVGPNDPERTALITKPQIRHALKEACREAPEGGVLLIHFSGHGVSVEGRDYLVPGEIVSLAEAAEDTSQLVPVDLAPYLGPCRARTVVFAVDACREIHDAKGVTLSSGPEFGRGALDPAHRTRVMTVFGCRREQYCYYSESLGMSLFTKALCTALAQDHRAQTLGEVLVAADQALGELVARYKPKRDQQLSSLQESGAASNLDDVICAGSADPWRAAVAGSALWSRVDVPHADLAAQREAVASVASTAWSWWQRCVDRVPDDPWRDPEYIPRCLKALELLVPEGARLHPPEVTALLTAPLLAEVVHADGLLDLVTTDPLALLDPTDPDRDPEAEALRAAHPRLCERALAVADDHSAEALGIATWLAHRYVFRAVGLWRDSPAGEVSAAVSEVAETRKGFRGGHAAALRALATFVGTPAEEIDAFLDGADEGRRNASQTLTVAWRTGGSAPLRAPTLALLVALAGWLGLDMRRIGEVAVAHLGPRDALDPAELRLALAEATWNPRDGSIELEARCSHPVIDLALRENVAAVQALLVGARRRAGRALDLDVVGGLPAAATADGVAPEVDEQGHDVYETPLLQFRLAHDEVRDLLMGVRLYGDPALAVRELYQNALDACRYRKLRARYLELPYRGEITIRQGADHDGREFIECVDNGVGMSRSDIERSFSRAGRRFVTSTAFLWEQAEWLRKDPELRLWPNSRFGIGVFSYFMIAEEVLVETAVVGATTNAPSDVLDVRIASSGSLFRITSGDRTSEVARSGGTRVRLYLHREGRAVSSRGTLTELLWYSEFDVRCIEDGRAEAVWEAGVLSRQREWTCPAGPDTWWTGGRGALLADGVAVGAQPFGFVANLWGRQAPTLTVDRNNLESWDKDAVRAALVAAAPALRENGHPDLLWLVTLTQDLPVVAQVVFEEFVRHGQRIAMQAERPHRVGGALLVDLARTGVGAPDGALVAGRDRHPYTFSAEVSWSLDGEALGRARITALRRAGVDVPPGDDERGDVAVPLDTIDGHPRPEPIDHALLERPNLRRRHGATRSGGLLATSAESGLTIMHLADRLRRYVLYGVVPPAASADDDADDRVADLADLALWEGDVAPGEGHAPPMSVLVTVSRDHGLPLQALARRVERLVAADGNSDIPVVTDADYVTTDADVELFVSGAWRRRDGAAPGSARHMTLVLAREGRPEAFRGLVAALGLPAAVVALARELVDRTPLARAMSHSGDGTEPHAAGELSSLSLLVAAGALGVAPGDAASALAAAAAVLEIRLPDTDGLPPRILTERETAVLGVLARCLRGRRRLRPPLREPVPGHVYALAAAELDLAPRVVWETLAPLLAPVGLDATVDVASLPPVAPTGPEKAFITAVTDDRGPAGSPPETAWAALGVPPEERDAHLRRWGLVPPVDLAAGFDIGPEDLLRAGGQEVAVLAADRVALLSPSDRKVLSSDLDGVGPFVIGRVTPLHVVRAARRTRESILGTVARLSALAPEFSLVLPAEEELDARALDTLSIDTLLPDPSRGRDSWLTTTDVVLVAAANRQSCAWVLECVRPLMSERGRDASGAPDVVPTPEDAVAVLLGRRPSTPVAPLGDLARVPLLAIRTATYQGWPVAAVCDRLARFASLLPYEPPACSPELGEYVPDWRDVVLVTRGLDGVAPLTDEVLAEGWFVPRAARALELTEDDVVTRLRLVADFIGFEASGM